MVGGILLVLSIGKKLDILVKVWYNISREWGEIANPASLERHDRVSEIVNASCVSVSIERSRDESNNIEDHRLGEVRFLSRLPNYRNKPSSYWGNLVNMLGQQIKYKNLLNLKKEYRWKIWSEGRWPYKIGEIRFSGFPPLITYRVLMRCVFD